MLENLRRHIMMQQAGGGVEILPSIMSYARSFVIIPNIYADNDSELYVKFSVDTGDGGFSTVGFMYNTANEQIGGGGWAKQLDLRFGTSHEGFRKYAPGDNIEAWVNKNRKTQIFNGVQYITNWNGSFQGEFCNFCIGAQNKERGLVGRFYEISLQRNGEYTMRLLPAKKGNKYGFYEEVTGVSYESMGEPYGE